MTAMSPEPTKVQYRSAEETAMRGLVVARLREAYPEARIVHELPLRYSQYRIDLAAIGRSEIVGVELKSSKDTTERLAAQIRAFSQICSKVIVGLAPKWNQSLPSVEERRADGAMLHRQQRTEAQRIIASIGEYNIETWTVCSESGTIARTDGGYCSNPFPWPVKLLDVLHVAELERVCFDYRIPVHKRTHIPMRDACCAHLTGKEAVRAVCSALRTRNAFAKESDPPIMDAPIAVAAE